MRQAAVPPLAGAQLGGTVGVDDCNGAFSFDLNAFASGGLGGNPAPELRELGRTVKCQYWGRDSGFPAPNNSMLSDALEYLIARGPAWAVRRATS